MKDRKFWNLRKFRGLSQYQYIFVFFPLQMRQLCSSTSMASRKFPTVFMVILWASKSPDFRLYNDTKIVSIGLENIRHPILKNGHLTDFSNLSSYFFDKGPSIY